MHIDDVIGSFQEYTSQEQQKKDKTSRARHAQAGKRASGKKRADRDACTRCGKTLHTP